MPELSVVEIRIDAELGAIGHFGVHRRGQRHAVADAEPVEAAKAVGRSPAFPPDPERQAVIGRIVGDPVQRVVGRLRIGVQRRAGRRIVAHEEIGARALKVADKDCVVRQHEQAPGAQAREGQVVTGHGRHEVRELHIIYQVPRQDMAAARALRQAARHIGDRLVAGDHDQVRILGERERSPLRPDRPVLIDGANVAAAALRRHGVERIDLVPRCRRCPSAPPS